MPRPGRNNKRENEIRRIKTAQGREDKVVLGYFMTRHPKIYEEARKYAQQLASANPGKVDLTKTTEYYAFLKHPHTVGNMELTIELMDEGDATAAKPTEALQELPDEGDATAAKPMEAPQELPDEGDAAAAKPTEALQELPGDALQHTLKDLGLPPAEGATALPLNDEEFNYIINELSQDPTIAEFFNNYDMELDDCPLW